MQNWVDGNGCIAREETDYLACRKDLLSVTVPDDSALTWLETSVENSLIRFSKWFGRVSTILEISLIHIDEY